MGSAGSSAGSMLSDGPAQAGGSGGLSALLKFDKGFGNSGGLNALAPQQQMGARSPIQVMNDVQPQQGQSSILTTLLARLNGGGGV